MSVTSVEVWVIALDDAASGLDIACLDDAEVTRMNRMRDARTAGRFAAAHVARRAILAARLGTRPEAVAIRNGPCTACGEPHGKPGLGGRQARLQFSLARSAGFALLAVADRAVGVDLESRSQGLAAASELADEVLGERAATDLAVARPDERATAVLAHWVRVEAVLKATGAGLNTPPASVDVRADHALVPANGGPPQRVELLPLRLPIDDQVVALAVVPPRSPVRLRRWPADLRS